MVLTTYGRSSGFCIDPIEKKPLNHFYPGLERAFVRHRGLQPRVQVLPELGHLASRARWTGCRTRRRPDAIADAAVERGCKSVAFTYNDPVIFAEYAMDIADACHALGVKTVAVTAGYIHAEPRREFYAKMDAANVDLKAFTDEFYFKLCGARLQPVLDTLVYLKHETDVWFEITTLLIPGKNDSDEEIEAMCAVDRARARADVPLHFTAFHPDYKMTDIAADAGRDADARARHRARRRPALCLHRQRARPRRAARPICPGCAQPLIVRDWYQHQGVQAHARSQMPAMRNDRRGRIRTLRGPVRPAAHSARDQSAARMTPATARGAALIVLLSAVFTAAHAQPFPTRPIRLISPTRPAAATMYWRA